jgi:uncharacterized protein (TIGR03118 family)
MLELKRPTTTRRKLLIGALALAATATGGLGGPAAASARGHEDNAFRQVNLASDLAGLAPLTDPDVRNPWGIAFGPATPLWVNNEFSDSITLYSGANGVAAFRKLDLRVTASSPFGIVFNPTNSFVIKQNGVKQPARFIFNEAFAPNEQTPPTARLTAWTNAGNPPPTTTVIKATKPASLQFGLALVPGEKGKDGKGNRGPRLLAADGINGVIDVYDSKFHKVKSDGLFVDPNSTGLAPPYNVMFLKGRVYVTYAAPEPGSTSAVSVFRPDGRFIKRLVTDGPLAGPWGMAIAPEDWGEFGGALLVGNVEDGKINAFNRRNGRFLGTISDAHGMPLVNLGLWGIAFGNGVIGTPNTLIFAAGIGAEVAGQIEGVYEHGLIGLIEPDEKR